MEYSRTEREYQIQWSQVPQAPKDRLKSSSEELCTLDRVPKRELLESQTYELNSFPGFKGNAFFPKRKNSNRIAMKEERTAGRRNPSTKKYSNKKRKEPREELPKGREKEDLSITN